MDTLVTGTATVVEAKCIRLEWQPGVMKRVQNVKKYRRAYLMSDGCWFQPTGYGWATISRDAHFVLYATVDGDEVQMWCERFFRNELGKLVKGVRDKIAATMPENVRVTKRIGQKGTEYYQPIDEDLKAWLERIYA